MNSEFKKQIEDLIINYENSNLLEDTKGSRDLLLEKAINLLEEILKQESRFI